MPLTEPFWVGRNFTPTSICPLSGSARTDGVAVDGQMLQGQLPGGWVPAPTVTDRPAEGVSVRALSSVARLWMVSVPLEVGTVV